MKKKVLVIHNCPTVAPLVEYALEDSNYEVVSSTSLEEAIKLLKENNCCFMLVGNRFGRESLGGDGDAYIPKLLEASNVPYGRISTLPGEINEEFLGVFVVNHLESENLVNLPSLLDEL